MKRIRLNINNSTKDIIVFAMTILNVISLMFIADLYALNLFLSSILAFSSIGMLYKKRRLKTKPIFILLILIINIYVIIIAIDLVMIIRR